MASAQSKQVTTVVPGVSLDLTKDEAKALATVCYNIGGSSHSSRRRHTDSISKALSNVGIYPSGGKNVSGSIRFEEMDE